MKKNMSIPALVIITICVLVGCNHAGRFRHGLDVSISESGSSYKMQAYYNRNKTGAVQRFINREIQPSGLYQSEDDYFDVHTELSDRTRFYIKSSPGKIIIKINKRENSYASYMRVKNICEGVANILKNE